MKELWCWRCKMIIPMLDEVEFKRAEELYKEGMHNHGVPLSNREDRFKKLLDFYFEVTGYDETEPNAVMHHRISLYGPQCENCGKPYRTDKASFCAACGHRRSSN